MRLHFVLIHAIVLLLVSLPAATGSAQSTREVAVIVHPGVPDEDLGMAEIRRLLMGDRQFWAAGLRVTLLVRAPVAHERDVLLKKIYRLSEAQFSQYWIGKVFRNETTAGPKIVYSNEMASQLVRAIPGSITFVDASEVPADVRVLRIDGKLPGDPGYPLN